jgi:NADPH-dependent F420 reductase
MAIAEGPLAGVKVAVLGGTGPQGRGLVRRWAAAGVPVVVGSRAAERAAETAADLAGATGGDVRGLANADAAAAGDVVVVAVPWDGHADLVAAMAEPLAGKVVVDCVNPLGFDKQGAFALAVGEGSAAEQAAALLPGSTVVAAFHHVSAALLDDSSVTSVDTDVLVLGDDRDATDLVRALADVVPGMRGVYGGRLRNARQVEALTANLISVNRRYKAHAGIRITDV